MNRSLVVCYSRGGAMRRVATELSELLGADLDREDPAGGFVMGSCTPCPPTRARQ